MAIDNAIERVDSIGRDTILSVGNITALDDSTESLLSRSSAHFAVASPLSNAFISSIDSASLTVGNSNMTRESLSIQQNGDIEIVDNEGESRQTNIFNLEDRLARLEEQLEYILDREPKDLKTAILGLRGEI
jgi:hypothetical protein